MNWSLHCTNCVFSSLKHTLYEQVQYTLYSLTLFFPHSSPLSLPNTYQHYHIKRISWYPIAPRQLASNHLNQTTEDAPNIGTEWYIFTPYGLEERRGETKRENNNVRERGRETKMSERKEKWWKEEFYYKWGIPRELRNLELNLYCFLFDILELHLISLHYQNQLTSQSDLHWIIIH